MTEIEQNLYQGEADCPATSADHDHHTYVVFRLQGYEHALDVDLVKNIITPHELSAVMEAADFVEGVIKVSGVAVPVIDVRTRMGLLPAEKTFETAVIVMRGGDHLVGLQVDAVVELVRVPAGSIEAPIELAWGVETRFMRGIAYLDDRLLVMLNVEELLCMEETRPLASTAEDPDELMDAKQVLNKVIVFELGGELYGVDVAAVVETMELPPIRSLPNVEDYILGLMNQRGAIVPVIDLRHRFDLQQPPLGIDSRLVIVSNGELQAGIVVDAMYGLLRLPQEVFQPPPEDVELIDKEFFKEVTVVDGRMLIVLDVDCLLHGTARSW